MVKATRGVQGREFITKRGLHGMIPHFTNSTHVRCKQMPAAAGGSVRTENVRRPH